MPGPYRIILTADYIRIAKRFLKRHPDMARGYQKTLVMLELNPHHPSLRLHALRGRHEGVHSVSINLSCRITLNLQITEQEIILLNVGDHDTVY